MKQKKVGYEAGPKGEASSVPAGGESGAGGVLREPDAAYVVGRVRDGLDFAEFQALREMLVLTEEKLGSLLGMSRATLHRRKKSGHLDRAESDRLVRYARILNCATGLFMNQEKAAKWLGSPALAFNGETPLDYADTEIGAREVEGLIGRIEHGIPA